LDPDISGLGNFFHNELQRLGSEKFLVTLASRAVEAAGPQVSAIKIQSAFYEQFGDAGWSAMKATIAFAHSCGLPVIFDAKRGDISSTMNAYGRAAFDDLGADSMTVTAWMGFDVLSPLLPWMRQGRGVFVVWSTSNPAAAAIQEQKLSTGQTVADSMMEILDARISDEGVGRGVGWVLGATRLDVISRMVDRGIQNRCWLLPGIGAQGAPVSAELRTLMRTNPASLIPLSRGMINLQVDLGSWGEFSQTVESRSKHWQKQLL